MRQNIQYDQTLMVPTLFCEDMCPRLTCEIIILILLWPSRLQVAICCPTEVDAGPLIVDLKYLSIEVIYIEAY
jgi:hypothetical protein